MQPPQVERGLREDGANALRRRSAGDIEAELRVGRAGEQMRVRVRLDARPHPQQHRLLDAVRRRETAKGRDLVEVVDDDAPDPLLEGVHELALGLVVAVKEDAVAWEVGARRGAQLAARHDVEAKP